MSEKQFVLHSIDYKNYYINSEKREILFAIDWDYFFFFVCIDSGKV